jgi:hypothetical protein
MSFVQNDPPALHLQDGANGGFYCATLHRIILSGLICATRSRPWSPSRSPGDHAAIALAGGQEYFELNTT